MSESLKELRTQRALIQKHVDWLDAKIKQIECVEPSSIQESAPKNIAATTSQTEVPQRIPNEAFEEPLLTSYGISEVRHAKIGCFVFFAVITLLFLFLLFGLPYLLD